jgi:hypothetical protein
MSSIGFRIASLSIDPGQIVANFPGLCHSSRGRTQDDSSQDSTALTTVQAGEPCLFWMGSVCILVALIKTV